MHSVWEHHEEIEMSGDTKATLLLRKVKGMLTHLQQVLSTTVSWRSVKGEKVV